MCQWKLPGFTWRLLLHNDVSERDFHFATAVRWVKEKCDSLPSWSILGPPREDQQTRIPSLWLKTQWEILQGPVILQDLIFDLPTIISIESNTTLLPGDVISTGTPAGVRNGLEPEPKYLEPGNRCRVGNRRTGRFRASGMNDPEA